MNYLSEKYGLTGEVDPKSENGQLFLANLILIQKDIWPGITDHRTMLKQIGNCKVEEGLYHRNPDLKNKTISHDNLSGIMSWSFAEKTGHRFEIGKYLVKHIGRYDNTKGKSPQFSKFLPFNPANFFIWGLSAESRIYLLFFPFFLVSMILGCRTDKQNTSGKILYWVEMKPHKDHWLVKHLFSYYEKRMKALYGQNYLKELMFIYHGGNSSEFPLLKIWSK